MGIPVCISLCPLHSLFVYGSSEEVGSHRSMMSQSTICICIGNLRAKWFGIVYCIIDATFHFAQVQAPNIVKADLPAAYTNSLSETRERSEVWPKNSWTFSDVIYCPEDLCEAH